MRFAAGKSPQQWVARFGDAVPTFAYILLDAVRAAVHDSDRLPDGRESAQALGVLRAQQGHAVAGLVEDLAALRELVGGSSELRHRVADATPRCVQPSAAAGRFRVARSGLLASSSGCVEQTRSIPSFNRSP